MKRKTKLATLTLAIALLLALASPTLLNSLAPQTKGWRVQLYNVKNPIERAMLLAYATTINLVAIGMGKLGAKSKRKISAFFACTIIGAGLLALTFTAMTFAMRFGGPFASKTFAEEWRTWLTYDMPGFVATHVAMALAATTLGLLFGTKIFSGGPPLDAE